MKTYEIEVTLGSGDIFDIRILDTNGSLSAFVLSGDPSGAELQLHHFHDEIQLLIWKKIAEFFAKQGVKK